MKKVIFFILFFILICFMMPVLFTNRKVKTLNSLESVNLEQKKKYNYKDYSTIKLLHSRTNEIEELKLDEYLYGVVSAEMPANYEMEALKAQAVVARTYTLYNIINNSKHENANICDLASCCQAWISKEERLEKWSTEDRNDNWNKITQAVDSTAGKIITYNEEPICAFFHANSGGKTEKISDVWGETEGYPYLQTVATSRRRYLQTI